MSPPREKTPKLHPNRSNSGGPHRGPLEWSHVEPAESPSPQNIDGNRSADPIAVKQPDQIVHPVTGTPSARTMVSRLISPARAAGPSDSSPVIIAPAE